MSIPEAIKSPTNLLASFAVALLLAILGGLGNYTASLLGRTATLEAKDAFRSAQMDRIEQKVDRILERGNK